MTLSQYARGSRFENAKWRRAEALLRGCGFSPEDISSVLEGAYKNALNPENFARAAIQLRNHVNSGLPLNRDSW